MIDYNNKEQVSQLIQCMLGLGQLVVDAIDRGEIPYGVKDYLDSKKEEG